MNEFFAGCSSGILQSLIGHPIDTAKVLKQTRTPMHKNFMYYYRGITYPTTFNILCTGITFDIHSRYKKYTGSHYYGGFLSGFTMAPIIYYFDVGKIHYQLNPKTPISLSQFKKTNGIFATFARESISTAFYMGVYFDMVDNHGPLVSGGVAGLTSWTVTYPLDVIKTRQMSDQYASFRNAMRIGNLWNGFLFCAIRAVLCNAGGFWAYNNTQAYLLDT